MVVHAAKANTAYRLQRTFKWPVFMVMQVRLQEFSPGTLVSPNFVIANDQGAVANGIKSLNDLTVPRDGFRIDAASTDSPAPPFGINWQGELWYAADRDNADFSLVITTETSQRL